VDSLVFATDLNMCEIDQYAKLVRRGTPDCACRRPLADANRSRTHTHTHTHTHTRAGSRRDQRRDVLRWQAIAACVWRIAHCGERSLTLPRTVSMASVPWHDEVVNFGQQLCDALDGEYEIAVEHEHSCLVLLAPRRFRIDGQWHTWIDYAKFFELNETWRADPSQTFTSADYVAPSPHWA
jgi:hypothetical protein